MRDPIIPTRSRQRIAADNRAELDGWIDERVAELVAAGVRPEDARRRALAEFGDMESAERYAERQDMVADQRVRVTLWLEELIADVRIALRTLARTPTVTSVVLLTFALGIGATTAVFSVVHAMLLRPLPYGDERTLVYLAAVENGVVNPRGRFSAAALVALRERTTSFTGIAGVEIGNYVVSENGDPELMAGIGVTEDAFEVLLARPALGRAFATREMAGDGSSGFTILGDALWRRRFGGDPAVLGRTIDLSGSRHQVIGIMPPGFRIPTYENAEFLTPRDLSGLLRDPNVAQKVRFLRLFGRLKAGVSMQTAQADVDRAMHTLQTELPQSFSGFGARVMPMRTAIAGSGRLRLLVLMGAAAFVLLIACANVAGILLSRAIARRHELSVRVALGAGRRRLMRQFLGEGIALSLLASGLGLAMAQLGITALRQVAPATLPAGTTFALEPRVVLFAMAAAVTSALAASMVPALVATRLPAITLRRDAGRASPSRSSRVVRLGLVSAQLAISLVLLIGAGLFLRTLHRLSVLDLGYSTERALTFRLQFPRARYATAPEQRVFWESLYEQLRAIPGVVAVGTGNVPLGPASTATLQIEHRPIAEGRLPDVRYVSASDDYFAALGVPLVRGRAFMPADRDSTPLVAIVSAGLARQFWPDGDPIGARITLGPALQLTWARVVGIVGDVRMGSAEAPQPSVYLSQRQDTWRGGGTVIIRTRGNPRALVANVRDVVKRVDSMLPIVGLRTLDEFRRSTPGIADRRLQMQLLLAFAIVALVVSAIGVYGVSAYATTARAREFGIRMALGAPRHEVLWLALRDGASAAAIGAVVGLPLALLLASRFGTMLYEVPPFDPMTVGVVLATLLVVVLVSSLLPARRATLVDPARTMRLDH